jgi:hypothetical protein
MKSETRKIGQMLHRHTAPIAGPGRIPDTSMIGHPGWIVQETFDGFCYLSVLIAFGALRERAGALDL